MKNKIIKPGAKAVHEVRVNSISRNYPVYIGSDLLSTSAELLSAYIVGEHVMVISNTTVSALYGNTLRASLGAYRLSNVTLADGEGHKRLQNAEYIFNSLAEARCDKHVTIIALGGGVIGDIAGFAAACYQRGVAFIQIPTTLLAQVDASLGGKTGVNLSAGKNLVGAFHQPRCVLADTHTLETLPAREFSSGVAEIIKYGLIRDADFFNWLEENMEKLLQRQHEALVYAIQRSCINKAKVVESDEHEHGPRALLNLGHTFAHAIEAAMNYGGWLHGEAVAAGMMMAADMSQRLGWLDEGTVVRIARLLTRAQLPTRGPVQMTPQQYMHFMAIDKKNQSGRVRLILLNALGNARIVADYPDEALAQTLRAFCRADK